MPLAVFNGIDGKPMKQAGIPVLAFPQVRYVGEAIALVIATDEKTAQLAAEQIEISLDVQTGAISLKIALALCFSAIRKSYAV